MEIGVWPRDGWWSVATNIRGHPQYVFIGWWFSFMRSHIDEFDEDCGYGKRGEHHYHLTIGRGRRYDSPWRFAKEWTRWGRECFICRRDGR